MGAETINEDAGVIRKRGHLVKLECTQYYIPWTSVLFSALSPLPSLRLSPASVSLLRPLPLACPASLFPTVSKNCCGSRRSATLHRFHCIHVTCIGGNKGPFTDFFNQCEEEHELSSEGQPQGQRFFTRWRVLLQHQERLNSLGWSNPTSLDELRYPMYPFPPFSPFSTNRALANWQTHTTHLDLKGPPTHQLTLAWEEMVSIVCRPKQQKNLAPHHTHSAEWTCMASSLKIFGNGTRERQGT